MRATVSGTILTFMLAGGAALSAACGHGGAALTPAAGGPDTRATGAVAAGPPQYVVADPGARSNVVALALGGGASSLGLVVDKTRIVIGRGEPRASTDLPDQPIGGALRMPGRLGGGFLFWTDTVLYRADSFDARLQPLARLPDGIQTISFAPHYLLARTRNGERWGLAVPSGERMAIDPLGAADVEGLDDGRALAFNDSGAAFSSMDHGAHWTDVTSEVKSSPSRVAVVDEELWLFESSGSALRLEPDGHLSSFDKQPVEKTPEMRARDPRWRGAEAPLRTAFFAGASIDDNTAIVVEQGDVVRIDVHSGEIQSIVSGKLPPDARCEAVPTANDVLFACVSRGGAGGMPSAFVVSHTLSGDAPTVEQSFQAVAQFYASDDGGLAIAAPCTGIQTTAQEHTACVRQPGGTWQDYDLSALVGDGGPSDVTVSRWVPRADGRAVAVLLDPVPGIYDPRTGQLEAVDPAGRDALGQSIAPGYARLRRAFAGSGGVPFPTDLPGGSLVDWSWSFSATGSLRGWQRHGGIVELNEGKLTRSPYAFDIVTAGSYALGRTPEGRFYQSTDHGATWTEVLGPPSGTAASEMRSCTTAGCDLGGFYRVGWDARPPRVQAPVTPALAAPEVRRTRPVEVSCHPSGAVRVQVLPRTDNSPNDLGLGMNRLPVAGDSGETAFVRNTVPRTIENPLHDTPAGDSDTPALRGLLSGFSTSRDADVLEVQGPNKNVNQLRRTFAFVAPFDPASTVKKAVIPMSEVIAAGRLAGMTNDEILSDDMTESGEVVVMTPSDPALPDDLVFHNARGLVARVRANERVKVAMRPTQNDGTNIISAVAIANDEAAFLELEGSGVGHVFKLAGGGITDLFDVNPTANDAALFYPANPDALAVGPHGDLAVIRTGSGSDPASAVDPALLLVSAMPPVALAPWSTLKLGDDPTCKEPGWRTTLQLIAPWLRVSTLEMRAEDAPMIARVKWSDKRVCLEAFEVKVADVTVRAPGASGAETLKVSSWLVARGGTYMRVAIADGLEWRQPLECTLSAAKTP